jgi:hypothetical protein
MTTFTYDASPQPTPRYPITTRCTVTYDPGPSPISRLADISMQRTNMVYDPDPRPIKHYRLPVDSPTIVDLPK